jgi:hypothetical protein
VSECVGAEQCRSRRAFVGPLRRLSQIGLCFGIVVGATVADARPQRTTVRANDIFGMKLAEVPPGQLQVIVSINRQRAMLYSDGKLVARVPVSTGVPSHPTPTGIFAVLQKNKWHSSNLYSNAPMHYMHRITWSGVALHSGELPGYPASHGCIRLPDEFVTRLWEISDLGMRVIVLHGEAAPVEIADEWLFAPRKPAAVTPAAATPKPKPVPVAAATVPALPDRTRTLPPVQPLTEDTAFAQAPPPETAAPAQPAPAVAPKPEREPEVTASLPRRVQRVVPDSAEVTSGLTLSPISVFVSRKARKVYVRKNYEQILEAAVTIDSPAQPLGTHVFTAMNLKTNGDMRWTVISLPEEGVARGRLDAFAAAESSAHQALARVTIPQAVRERISDLLTPGASLIIADAEPTRRETGRNTDFVLLTPPFSASQSQFAERARQQEQTSRARTASLPGTPAAPSAPAPSPASATSAGPAPGYSFKPAYPGQKPVGYYRKVNGRWIIVSR